MAIVLDHRDFGVQAAQRHPALHGLKRLARGAFCSVYDRGDTVLKLTCDQVQYWMSTDGYRPEGPFFPRLVKDHGNVGTTKDGLDIYLMEMEKLTAIGRSAPIDVKRLRRDLLSQTNKHVHAGARTPQAMRMESYVGLGKIIDQSALAPGLIDALERLRDWISNYDASCDFHAKNLMMRGDQLVLNDVVCDPKAVVNILYADW